MTETSNLELGEKMITQKISVPENSHSFVIDMETMVPENSRITRSLSKKGSQRGSEKKMSSNSGNDRDSIVASTSSPRAPPGGMPDSSSTTVVATEPSSQAHQITINASNTGTTPRSEGKTYIKRNSFRRSSSWGLHPRRILVLFATLSSIGTILLIYFTLSISKVVEESGLEMELE